VKLLAAISKRDAQAEPAKPPASVKGRELVAAQGVVPGGIYTVDGHPEPMFIDHVDFERAGRGEPCIVAYPARDPVTLAELNQRAAGTEATTDDLTALSRYKSEHHWRNDTVLALADVEGPARLLRAGTDHRRGG
jgi:hypothetical protein